jgi:hypothetical protein
VHDEQVRHEDGVSGQGDVEGSEEDLEVSGAARQQESGKPTTIRW